MPKRAHVSVKERVQIRDKGAIGSRPCSLSTQSINLPAAKDAAGIFFFGDGEAWAACLGRDRRIKSGIAQGEANKFEPGPHGLPRG